MKRIALGMLLSICLAETAHSQQQTPQLLIRTARCLAAKKFLPASKATKLSFGYLVDEKSYPGDKVIYVVKYASPARSNGLVFSVFLTEHEGRQNFNVQNNASFVLSKGELGVDFVNPPLGGTWTQEHLASAIKQIEKQPRFTVSAQELSAMDATFGCEAYTDPRGRRAEK